MGQVSTSSRLDPLASDSPEVGMPDRADTSDGTGGRGGPGGPGGGGAAPRGATLLTSPVLIGLLAGAQAVVGSLVCVVAPVLATWLVASDTGATWEEAVRVAADVWLLAHGASVALPSGRLGIVPLGLTLLPLLWCYSAGRRVAVALESSHPARQVHRGRVSRSVVPPDRAGLGALAGVVVAYLVLAVAVALVAGTSVARPEVGSVLVGSVLVAALAGGAGLWRARARLTSASTGRPVHGPVRVLADVLRLPASGRAVVRAGVRSVAWSLGAAAVLLATALLLGAPQVLELHQALAPGVVGGVVLVLGQLLLLPTAVVWALAWLAGPGFAVGVGTSVSPAGTTLGPLPALPLLGALPEPGVGGGSLWAVVLLPVAFGALAGVRLRAATPLPAALQQRLVPALVRSLATGAVAGVLAAVLTALSSGPVGPGALVHVGPSPLVCGPVLGGLVALGVAVALAVPASWTRERTAAGLGPASRAAARRLRGTRRP